MKRAALFVVAAFGVAPSLPASDKSAKPLAHAAEVRQLSAEAANGTAVHLRGVVTALSGWKSSFFFQDASGGISVDRRDQTDVRQGDEVEIFGTTGPGLFAPVVLSDRVRVVGKGTLPTAREFSWQDLASGSEDSQWTELTGIIRTAQVAGIWGRDTLLLDVRTLGGNVQVLVHDFPGGYDFGPLVGSSATLRGVSGTNFNDRRQMLGLRLFVPGLDYLTTRAEGSADPFAAPLQSLDHLLHFGAAATAGHRVRVEGAVTFVDRNEIYLQQGDNAIRVKLAKPVALRVGNFAKASGFIEISEYSPELEEAVASESEPASRARAPIALAVSPQALIESHEGFTFAPHSDRLVMLDAELLDIVQRGNLNTLLLKAGDVAFHATLEAAAKPRSPLGSQVRLTGICRIDSGKDRVPRFFTLLLRSGDDIVVLKAPFWTLGRASWLVCALFIALCWILLRAGLFRTAVTGPAGSTSAIPGIETGFLLTSRICAMVCGWLSLLMIVGWEIGNPTLAGVATGYAPMAPNAAIGMVLLSLAVWIDIRARRTALALALAAAVLLLGAAGITQILLGADLHFNQLFVHYPKSSAFPTGDAPGKLALATCVNFILLGLALLARLEWGRERLAQGLAIAASVVCLLHGLRILLGGGALGSFSALSMALPTVAMFSLLCIAVLFARPREGIVRTVVSDSPGGIVSRRLLPAAILIPAALSWLSRQGEVEGFYGTAVGLIAITLSTTVVFVFIILLASALLDRMDGVRSQTEADLRASRKRLAQLADAMPQIVWSALPAGTPEYFNKRWFDYSGQDPSRPDQADSDSAVHPDDRERRWRLWKHALATGDPYSLEVRLKGSEGQYRWHLERVLPIAGEESRPVRWIGTCTDIEDYKQIQESLQQLNLTLEARVTERTSQAVSASRAKDQFLATVSHEIRTPMNAILGFTKILADTKLDAEQQSCVGICLRAGAALMALIDDVLDLSRIEAGGLSLENIPFDLLDVLEQSIELAAPRAHNKDLAIVLQSAPELTRHVVGDPSRLRQVLLNLLGNAAKFTHRGEIILRAVNIGPPECGRVAFSVLDTGIGIAADKLDLIFEDFRQADSSTTRLYGGTGLGLGIGRKLIERMGGRLSVESELGAGSTFRFELQFDIPFSHPDCPDSSRDTEPLRGLTLLLLDNNASSRGALTEVFSAWGLRCTAGDILPDISSVRAQLENTGEPALVLISCHSNEIAGLETAEALRILLPGVPIALVTANASARNDARRAKCRLAGQALNPIRRNQLARLLLDSLQDRAAAERSESALITRREDAGGCRGLRILVAEDMADNQLLFRAYLEKTAHILTFVDNGRSALQAYRRAQFDLVLMDTRMPVMDGLSAARAIREHESLHSMRATPIVAISANAFPEDKARSIASGCQEHLSKPISADDLLAAIERCSQPATAGSVHREHTRAARAARLLEKVKALSAGYIGERELDLNRISIMLELGNFEDIRTMGHNMKGTGTSFGFPEITRIGSVMEGAAERRETEAVQQTLQDLRSVMVNLRTSVEETQKLTAVL